jgi:hypothetical protein
MAKAPAKKAKKKVAAKKAANKKVVKKVTKKKVVTKKVVAKKAAVKKVVKKKVAAKKVIAKKVRKKIAPKKVAQKTTVKKAPIKAVTKKVVKKVATKKTATKPASKKTTKQAVEKSTTIDYFKLPFEVHYSECVSVTQYEFKSDTTANRFSDVKAVHMEQGRSWGALFSCDKNNGPELYCCLTDSHDEVEPSWLVFQEEDDIRFNHGCDYAVQIEHDEIKFVSLTDEQEDEDSEEYLNVNDMDYCCSYAFMAYEIGQSCPDYIILDADNSRIKIDLDGYELDDEDNRIDSRRIIDTDELDEEQFEDYETRDLWETKADWVRSILKEDFPKDINLRLGLRTE